MPRDPDHMANMTRKGIQARRVNAIERKLRELTDAGPLTPEQADRLTGIIQQGHQESRG